MKKYSILIFMVLYAIKGGAQADCSAYYPFETGTKFQLTMYNPKDKPTGVIDYLVKEASGNTATMSYAMHDEKGKLITQSDYDITCNNDGVSIDFNSLAAPGVMEQYKDMEVDISGTNLILPNKLQPGQSLPDANMLMNVSMTPIKMKMTIDVYDRKVDGQETVTTPAGTFDCFVISYKHDSKMGIKVSGSARQWLAEGVGMVKQETYNKKGKPTGSMILTSFEP